MARLAPVRLLFVLDGFEGWEARDNWSDLTFYAKYSDCIDRIAIVGDERWRSEALMFAAPISGARRSSSSPARRATRAPPAPG